MILSRILEHKKAELRHKQSRGYLSELKAKIQDEPGPLGFSVALEATRTAGSPALIAEVTKASPSLGLLRPEFSDRFDYLGIAKAYHADDPRAARGIAKWLDELIWREFYAAILETHPQVLRSAFRPEYDALRWNDEALDGKGFAPWTRYPHPQLGDVEIGGFDPKFFLTNPPPRFLEEWARKEAFFNLMLAGYLPQIDITGVIVKPAGGRRRISLR